ncbi:MAG: hypothetical protein AAGC55_09740 [Myxococcota bacterium]
MSDPRSQPPDGAPSALTPELIERLRQTGIRLDRRGRFWHAGREVTHPGLHRALLTWLDRLDDGRPVLRLDARRYAYVEVEDAHLLVLSLRLDGDRAFVVLNDGSEDELDYSSLRVAGDHALYCAVRDGRLEARLTTPAYNALAARIALADSSDDHVAPADSGAETFVLDAQGGPYPIARRG